MDLCWYDMEFTRKGQGGRYFNIRAANLQEARAQAVRWMETAGCRCERLVDVKHSFDCDACSPASVRAQEAGSE